MSNDPRKLELAAMAADRAVAEAEDAGDAIAAARLRARAILAWEAYQRLVDALRAKGGAA